MHFNGCTVTQPVPCVLLRMYTYTCIQNVLSKDWIITSGQGHGRNCQNNWSTDSISMSEYCQGLIEYMSDSVKPPHLDMEFMESEQILCIPRMA